ncbi:MAG: hypothetical protein A2Y23_00805 [Clostridiales bacterium GWB2_37_7]|nr:MAG: hypothetical protein A2Y23_00805 [Clostridiales bacterium GWB2_37_7]
MTGNKITRYLMFAIVIFSPTFYFGAYAAGVLAFFILIKNDVKAIADIMLKQKAIILMLIALALSTLFSKVPGYSLLIDLVILLHVMVYIVILKWVNKENIEDIFRLLNALGIMISIYGIYQYLTGDLNIDKSWTDENTFGNLIRIYSTMRNPNMFAAYLTFNISYAVAYFIKKKADIYVAINIMLSSISLILTYSRGGFFALAGAMLFIIIVSRELKVVYYLMIMVFLYYSYNFMQSTYRSDLSKLIIDSSSMYRVEIWKASWKLFVENILFGSGPGSVTKLLSYSSDKLKGVIMHSHNIPLYILSETGIFGLAAFAALLSTEIKRFIRFWKKHRDSEYSFVALGFAAAITAMLVHGMVDSAPLIPSRSLIFLIYLALFPALHFNVFYNEAKDVPHFYK